MKIKKSVLRIFTLLMMTIMVFGSVSSAFAAAPSKDEIEYDGKGRVEVEFRGKVDWKSPKITVTDSAGKKYTATIVKKDNDDITFKVNNYKEGKKYNFSISGVRARGTSGYGTFKGTFTIPASKAKATKATTKTISQNTAKTTAVNNAVSVYKMQKSTMRDYKVETDTFKGKKVWEVSFEAKRAGYKGWYEFEYKIDKTTGKVLAKDIERD